jgi:hypothetical protein
MSDAYAQFETRCASLKRKHSELAKGYTAKLDSDGLITLVPLRRRSYLTTRLILGSVVGFMLFKSVTIALVGTVTYQERIDALAAGTDFEKAAAWLMQADPVASKLAGVIAPYLP